MTEYSIGYQGTLNVNEPERCAYCGEAEEDMVENFKGFVCSSCTRRCAICTEWMLTEEGITDNRGNVAHRDCAIESLEYQEYFDEMARDRAIDQQISEWKDGDRAINGRYRGERV